MLMAPAASIVPVTVGLSSPPPRSKDWLPIFSEPLGIVALNGPGL